MENDMMAIVMAAGKGTRMKSKKSKYILNGIFTLVSS